MTWADDQSLIDACLAGEPQAWDALYQQQHAALLQSIRRMLGPWCNDVNVVEEIAATVWYAMVSKDGALLKRFTSARGSSLHTYLVSIAGSKVRERFRAEKRRRMREAFASRSEPQEMSAGPRQVAWELDEFLGVLSPAERSFCERQLLEQTAEPPLEVSSTNRWQLRTRIRRKLRAFVAASRAE